MKKFILISLLLSIILSGCSTSKTATNIQETIKPTMTVDQLFEKKQKCGSLTNELIEKTRLLGIEFASLGKASFEQVFYSPVKNNCLWVRSYTKESSNGSYLIVKSLYEYGDDSGSSESLYGCKIYFKIGENVTDTEREDDCYKLEDEIKRLKGE